MNQLTDEQRRSIENDCTMLMYRYAIYADHHPECFSEVFAEDAVWIRPGMEMHGAAEAQKFMDEAQRACRQDNPHGHLTRHAITTSLVEVQDHDRAEGIFYGLVFRDEDFAGSLPVSMNTMELVVEYRTRFVRTAAGWRIGRHQAQHVFRRAGKDAPGQ